MAPLDKYLVYFGLYNIYFASTLLCTGVLVFIILYGKYKGTSEVLGNLSFWIPIVLSVILCGIVFYSDHFWTSLLIYAITLSGINLLSFPALKGSIEDKSGMGVMMFSMMAGMYLVFGCIMVKGIIALYHLVF